jgi:hypothetical protein
MSTGWVKLHRKIFKNKVVCKDSDHFMVWCYLLTNAIHSTYPIRFNGEDIELQPGQLVTSCRMIQEDTGIDKSKVSRILRSFKEQNQISQQQTPNKTLITIVNWSEYQEKKVRHENEKSETRKNEKVRHDKNVVDKSDKRSNINNKNVDNFSKNKEVETRKNEKVRHENEKSETRLSINKNDIYKNDYSNTNKTNTTNTSNYSNRDIQNNSVVSVVALNKVLEEFKTVKPIYTVADINTAKQVLEDYSEEEIINAIHTSAIVQQLTGEEIKGFGAIRYLLNRKNKANTS